MPVKSNVLIFNNLNNILLLKFFFLFIGLLLLSFTSCDSDSGTNVTAGSGQWQLEGIDSVEVRGIHTAPNSDVFYLSTDKGVFEVRNNQFKKLGLGEAIDLVLLDDNTLLAGGNSDTTDATLFKSTDAGATWTPFMGNWGGEKNRKTVRALAIDPENKSRILGRGSMNVAVSENGGKTWTSTFLGWDYVGAALFLKVDTNSPQNVWAGGGTAISTPNLIRSRDGGQSWIRLDEKVSFDTETNVWDLVISPTNSEAVLIGMAGGFEKANVIRKSTDGGNSWSTKHTGPRIHALALSKRNPETVFATGRNENFTLFFLVSSNFGNRWETVTMENSPEFIWVNDLAVTTEEGKEVLWFGTNKGLYSYTPDN